MHRWNASAGDEGKKILEFIAEKFPEEDKKGVKALFDEGARVNGRAAKASGCINDGDIIELYTENTRYAYQTEVIYEDDNFFIVNKEQNISCYTYKGDIMPALYEYAERHMKEKGEYNIDSFAIPYICHGIDRHTGGLVMIAKDEIIYNLITDALKERRIKKLYKCIVAGRPEHEQEVLHDFIISKGKFDKLTISKTTMRGTVPVCIKYRVIAGNGEFSLLEVEMVTDHIAQICAQLALHGNPVLGDDVYGNARLNSKYGVKLPALWAYRLDFDVGKNNPIEYLDNTFIETENIGLPYIPGLGQD